MRRHQRSSAAGGSRGFAWALVVVAIVAGGLRFHDLDARDLWFDENCTFYIVHHLFDWPADGPDLLREVAHLPYFFLLNLWTDIVGETIWGMRSLSALIGALGVFVLGLLGTRLAGPRVGLIAALLATFNPLHVYYSQEARGYTTWLLAVTLCIYSLYKAAETLNKRWWMVYIVVAWLTVLAHYFTLAWFVGTISGVLIACDHRRFLRQWLVSHGLLAVTLLPVIWFLVLPLSEGGSKPWFREMWAAYPPPLAVPKSIWAMLPAGGYPEYLGSLAAAAGGASVEWGALTSFLARWVPLVVLALAVLLQTVRRRSTNSPDSQGLDRTIGFMTILSLAYLLAIFVHSWLWEPTYIVGRYDLAAWPSLILAVALVIERAAASLSARRGWQAAARWGITAVLLLCSGIVLVGMRFAATGNDSVQRARMIANTVGSDDLVISLGKYKLFVYHEWHQLDFQAEVISFPPQHDRQLCWYDAEAELANPVQIEQGVTYVTNRIEEALAQGRGVWLLIPGEPTGARWEVDRNLFRRLAMMRVEVRPIDEALGLARIVTTGAPSFP